MISITTHGDVFYINCPYQEKHLLAPILGARWNSNFRCYEMPATYPSAVILDRALNGAMKDDGFHDTLFKSLQVYLAYKTDQLKTIPWQHQATAIGLALQQSSFMLAMDMGTGKSLCAVAIANAIKAKRVLIVCPKSVIPVWPNQFQKHSKRYYHFASCDGSVANKLKQIKQALDYGETAPLPVVIVINYDAVWREPVGSFLADADFDLLILDESQRIKSPSGKASKYVGSSLQRIPKKLALSGFPMPHSPLDIFAQYRALDPGIFGQYYGKFRKRYSVMGGFQDKQVVAYKNQDELKERFELISYHVTKADALDLPEEVDSIVPITLDPATQKHYTKLERDFYVAVEEGEVTAANAMVKLLRLQQLTSGFMKMEASGNEVYKCDAKAVALKDILENLGNEKAVVFCRFRHDIGVIRNVCESLGYICGELSGAKNDLTETATYPDHLDVLAVQIQSGGVGVDLSLASVGVYYSLGLSLGDYLQSRSRLHRPGQENKVTFIHLLAEKTIDNKVYRSLEKKQKVIEGILKR